MNSYQLKNEQILIIRKGELQDAEAALAYVKRVGDETDLLTFCSADIKRSVAEQRALIKNHNAAVNEIFLVATIDEKIVGMLSVLASKRPRLQHVGEFGISVQKADWNKGIARRLIQEMLTWAQSNPIIRKIN